MTAQIDPMNTVYGDYTRILIRAYKDNEALTDLCRLYKNNPSYVRELEENRLRILKYETLASDAYTAWERVIILPLLRFGFFWERIEKEYGLK